METASSWQFFSLFSSAESHTHASRASTPATPFFFRPSNSPGSTRNTPALRARKSYQLYTPTSPEKTHNRIHHSMHGLALQASHRRCRENESCIPLAFQQDCSSCISVEKFSFQPYPVHYYHLTRRGFDWLIFIVHTIGLGHSHRQHGSREEHNEKGCLSEVTSFVDERADSNDQDGCNRSLLNLS